ncbi:MAG: response regulator [Nitrospinae bacterium]|nr:response regulator [Nitrospinota bacterium]
MEKAEILVVDDDKEIREMLKELFEAEGYRVATASTAMEGVKMIETDLQRFNVVVSDIMMPGISGLEFLKEIKKITKYIEVILMTGYSTMELAIDCLDQGAFSYLEKPLDQIETILDRVKMAVEYQRHKREIVFKAFQTKKKKAKDVSRVVM